MRSFKKIAAMIMAVAMLCSFTALGATVTLTDIADTTSATTEVAISYTSDASQNTILAFAGEALSGANVVYIDQLAKGATQPKLNLTGAPVDTTYTVWVGGTDVAEAAKDTFFYEDATLKYDVTLVEAEVATRKGDVSYDVASLEQVREGSDINFTFKPYLGYEINSIKLGDDTVNISGNTYKLTVTGDVTIEPVFTEVVATAESYTYEKTYDVDAVGEGETAEPASKLTFGKANEKADATITAMGMLVKKWNAAANQGTGDWEEFKTTGDEEYGPKFPAARWTSDYKYGIRFFAFDPGTYQVTSYVEYSDGTEVFGVPVTFEVK